MAIWVDVTGAEYGEGSPVTGPDGTNYPTNWDKTTLTFLTLVTEDPQPTGDIVITGREIVSGHLSWQSRPKTDSEKALEAQQAKDAHNYVIYAQLDEIDRKSIRPVREGDVARCAALEAQAQALRSQLQK